MFELNIGKELFWSLEYLETNSLIQMVRIEEFSMKLKGQQLYHENLMASR